MYQNSKSFALLGLGLSIFASGCNSDSGNTNTLNPVVQSNPAGPRNNDTRVMGPRKPVPPHRDEADPKEAFANTFVSGEKRMSLKNVVVSYVKSNSTDNVILNQWTERCSANRTTVLRGSFPSINLSLTSFECKSSRDSMELADLQLLTSNMDYYAKYIPAFPSHPNQFRLELNSINQSYFHWKALNSSNARTEDNEAFFDLFGRQQGDLGYIEDVNHFVQISFKQKPNGSEGKFVLEYTVDANQPKNAVHTEIKITADIFDTP